ncbi:S8 family peptidase [Deinococcus hopiensis]|uniref:Thermitase n=1 Tax=Deinococcus hopiensis KR-140 TaxID=695939 RepID=A0A1W1UGN9_9DEIO|nr:S8 family serine peptidase [Deinococcus hopiensis]SMB80265.1 thermitase [Deinococcus hopiensis KR-140]
MIFPFGQKKRGPWQGLALTVLGALALSACSTAPVPQAALQSSPGTASQGDEDRVVLGDTRAVTPVGLAVSGTRWWNEGSRWWAEGTRWWGEGTRWWAEGSRWWNEGTFGPMPQNTASFRLAGLDRAEARSPHAGEGVTVAVIDSGVDASHPMLRGAVRPGYDWVDDDDDASEADAGLGAGYGHGTAVAGLVRQVAPGAALLPLRVLGPDGSGRAADVARAIRFAVDAGAGVINLSVASSSSSEGVRAALQYAVGRGVLIVAASGNEGGDVPQAPARSLDGDSPLGQLGVSVTAVDAAGDLPAWSTRGGEVLAPGVQLESAYPGGRVVTATGSSFSAPIVSGALALALAEGRDARALAAHLASGQLLDVAELLR